MSPRYRRGGHTGEAALPAARKSPARGPKTSGGSRIGFRLALKIAARTSIRSVGRSALIAVMVALPVAGLAGIAVVYDSSNPTVEDRLTTELGETEAMLRFVSPGAPVRQSATNPYYWDGLLASGPATSTDLSALLPSGTRIVQQFQTSVTAETATGIAAFDAIEGPSWDESFDGRFAIVDGRSPNSTREVMVTAAMLPRLGVELGDTVRLRSPVPATVTIVGVLDALIWPDSAQYFFGSEGAFSDLTADERLSLTTFFLPDLAMSWDDVTELNASGVTVLSRSVLNDPPPPRAGYPEYDGGIGGVLPIVAIIAAFATFEVILLAGAAFTVTARQQQRTLATVASVGAPRGLLFRILAANGIVLGAIGGLIGIAVGVASGAAFMALTADGSSTRYYGFYMPWLWLAAIAVFAMLIGWIASLLPARNASRFDVVAALRGARKPPAPSKRRPVVGLVMLIVGVTLTVVGGILMVILLEAGRGTPFGHRFQWVPVVMLITGPILAQLGLVLCGPLLLRVIARVMRRMGIGARLASRDAARNPTRAVPALAAIMTTVFVAVFAMCMVASGQTSSNANHQYRQAMGQVAVPLSYPDVDFNAETATIVNYEHADAIEDALRDALEIDELRVLASVPDPYYFGPDVEVEKVGESAAAEGVAVPVIPPANLCPISPNSSEYTEEMNDPSSPGAKATWGDPRCELNYLSMSGLPGGHIIVGEVADLALVLDREPSAEARHTLTNGGAVSLYPEYIHDGSFTIGWWATPEQAAMVSHGGQSEAALRTETLDAVVDLPEHPLWFGVFITASTADRLGLDYENSTILASTKTMPTVEDSDALTQAMMDLPDNFAGYDYAAVERGPQDFAAPWMWGLLGLAGLISIASAAVAIGLARFDGRQDDATLSALGAGRRVRRSFAFWQALIISGAGAVLGAGMGLVPAFALGTNPGTPFVVPWLQVGLTMAVLPLLIACGSWLLATRNKVSARRMTIA